MDHKIITLLYFQLFKNAKTILKYWAIQKQVTDQDLACGP